MSDQTTPPPASPPAPTGPSLPPVGTVQSRAELLAAAGSRTARAFALRKAGGGPIVGLATTLPKNPDAPATIVVGGSPRPVREAADLVEAATPIPVWTRGGGGSGRGWTYRGLWRPVDLDTSTTGLADARASAPGRFESEDPPPVGVLRLEPLDGSHA